MNEHEEPGLFISIRELFQEIKAHLEEIEMKLDDRVTRQVFGSLQEEVALLRARVSTLEKGEDTRSARAKGMFEIAERFARFLAWCIGTTVAIFALLEGGIHFG